MRVLALGAGVQSTTVALLVKHGELPALDASIFADTLFEPETVYRHLSWLEAQDLPFPIYRVQAQQTLVDTLHARRNGTRFITMPMFTEGGGRLRRQCTREWKIDPIKAKIRELCGLRKGQRAPKGLVVEQWYGISRDEASRMRDSTVPWIQHRYPLVFDRPMTRQACLAWLAEHGYPEPPRSACVMCPFHSDAEWQRLLQADPGAFQQAVAIEAEVGAATGNQRERAYLHRSLVPLDQVDFTGGKTPGQLSWLEECTGHCGV